MMTSYDFVSEKKNEHVLVVIENRETAVRTFTASWNVQLRLFM